MQCHSDNGIQLTGDTVEYFLHLFIYQSFLGIKCEEFCPYIVPQTQIQMWVIFILKYGTNMILDIRKRYYAF